MPTVINNDPTVYNSATQEFTLGGIYSYNGKEYIYVHVDATTKSNAAANGDVFAWATTGTGYVSNMLAGVGASTAYTNNPPAGVAVGTISLDYYGFLLVRGRHTAVKGIATVTVGNQQKISTTAASGVDLAAADVIKPFGTALTVLSGGIYTVEVSL